MADDSPQEDPPPHVPGIYGLTQRFLPFFNSIVAGVEDVTKRRRVDKELWKDLLHRVLFKAWLTHCRYPDYFAKGSPRGWAERTAGYELIDVVRKTESDAAREEAYVQQVLVPYCDAADALQRMIEEEHRDEVFRTLQVLDPRQRAVIEKYVFENRSRSEVAAALGMSERTVKRLWEQIKCQLAPMLSHLNPRSSDTTSRGGDHA